MKNQNNKELSPCIVSWGRYALGMKTDKPKNTKKCTETYWHDVINTLVYNYGAFGNSRQLAIQRFYYVSKL